MTLPFGAACAGRRCRLSPRILIQPESNPAPSLKNIRSGAHAPPLPVT
jgi:hypothetical protein